MNISVYHFGYSYIRETLYLHCHSTHYNMANNMDQYRKSPRAKWLEYNEGVYFLTICTLNHVHYFGSIVDGEMCLSAVGAFLQNELEHVEQHHPHVSVLQYVVMPNHVHAIVEIGEKISNHATRCVPTKLFCNWFRVNNDGTAARNCRAHCRRRRRHPASRKSPDCAWQSP